MARFVLRRLALLPVVMIGVTALLCALLQFLSPEMRAALYVKDPRQLGALEEVIEKYRLRDPMPVQYGHWLKQIAHGDLGYSETAKMPVADALKAYFPATLELTLAAFLPILLLGLWLGTLSAVHKDRWIDHASRVAAITGNSMPSFVLGLLLLMIFYGHFHWVGPGRLGLEADSAVHMEDFFHYTGFLLLDAALNRQWGVLGDALKHMILPSATLVFISMALLMRVTRSSMLEELGKDYVRTARAKGLPERLVITRHARRNALIPVVTLSSLLFVGLLGGVVITETVFDYPGIGRWGVYAATQLDIPAVMGWALVSSTLFVAANLASDVLYAFIDPRIRIQ